MMKGGSSDGRESARTALHVADAGMTAAQDQVGSGCASFVPMVHAANLGDSDDATVLRVLEAKLFRTV
jgi:hypothetical protein